MAVYRPPSLSLYIFLLHMLSEHVKDLDESMTPKGNHLDQKQYNHSPVQSVLTSPTQYYFDLTCALCMLYQLEGFQKKPVLKAPANTALANQVGKHMTTF